jgi:hypothetical protein
MKVSILHHTITIAPRAGKVVAFAYDGLFEWELSQSASEQHRLHCVSTHLSLSLSVSVSATTYNMRFVGQATNFSGNVVEPRLFQFFGAELERHLVIIAILEREANQKVRWPFDVVHDRGTTKRYQHLAHPILVSNQQ